MGDTGELIFIIADMLVNNNYCWKHWSPINVEPWWVFGNELTLSFCVKALERCIIEGLCSSEGISKPRRVTATRNMKLKDAYGMVAVIMRVCQKEQ